MYKEKGNLFNPPGQQKETKLHYYLREYQHVSLKVNKTGFAKGRQEDILDLTHLIDQKNQREKSILRQYGLKTNKPIWTKFNDSLK